MKYYNKNINSNYRGDRNEILYFLKGFKIPPTNNPVESSQRSANVNRR